MTAVDVAIVGAGAAGLAAARTVRDAGRSFVVLEAKDRIGGRAYTNTHSFGVPWDEGCHWLHSASLNPYRVIADNLGVSYMERGNREASLMHLGERWAEDHERDDAWRVIESAFEASHHFGETVESDAPVSEVLDAESRWHRLVVHWMTLLSSVPPQDISAHDLAAYRDTDENFPVTDGYGKLVALYHKDIPVSLNTPVQAIRDKGSSVIVETERGDITAGSAIITASTNVLASGAIRFEPGLTPDLKDALENCPCGTVEKAAFLFDRDIFGAEASTYMDTMDSRDSARRPINFVLSPLGYPMAVGQIAGGEFGEGEAREAAMTDFALGALADAFGSNIKARVKMSAVTTWSVDPFIGGGYSCARPGHAGAREIMRQPVSERIFLAGEATSAEFYSTCHGAHLTGVAQAKNALKGLK